MWKCCVQWDKFFFEGNAQ